LQARHHGLSGDLLVALQATPHLQKSRAFQKSVVVTYNGNLSQHEGVYIFLILLSLFLTLLINIKESVEIVVARASESLNLLHDLSEDTLVTEVLLIILAAENRYGQEDSCVEVVRAHPDVRADVLEVRV